MVTRYFNITSDEAGALEQAATVIRAGGLVAFPTETVYGLGANATDAGAVVKIYVAKQRALNDPLIVHCALSVTERQSPLEALTAQQIVGPPAAQQAGQATVLIQHFWPGPLTLVLPRGPRIPTAATAGLDTVAVRMPDHPLALALIHGSGVPIAAPSANRFGHVSPTSARHVLDDLDGRIDLVLDGGPTPIGVESTVLDLTSAQPVILRPGGLAREEIERVIGTVSAGKSGNLGDELAQLSPGMLSKHYAPRAALRVVPNTHELLQQREMLVERGSRVGLLLMAAQQEACAGLMPQYVLGDSVVSAARNLYAGLRALDGAGVDVILVSEVERAGLGEAIADRLRRAAAR